MKFIYCLISCLFLIAAANNLNAQCNFTPLGSDDLNLPAYTGDLTDIEIDGAGTPYVAFRDFANGNKVSVIKYVGNVWVQVGAAGFTDGVAQAIDLAVDANGIPYVAFKEYNTVPAYYAVLKTMKYNGTTWVPYGVIISTPTSAPFDIPSFSIKVSVNGAPFVVAEYSTGASHTNYHTVQKYTTAGSWIDIGNAAFGGYRIAMAIDANETPYVIHKNLFNNGVFEVKKFNGANWVQVGPAIDFLSYNSAEAPCIAIDGNGTPYVSHNNIVKKFDGTTWTTLGAGGLPASISNLKLSVTTSGTPYVSFKEPGSGAATVMQYDGTAWVTVGTPAFSAGAANSLSLALNNTGSPYVAYSDAANGNKVTVMKFNTGNWEQQAVTSFSGGPAYYSSIATDNNGTPYVVYQDHANAAKATVRSYNGTSWNAVGIPGFSAGTVQHTTIAMDASNTPYVAYSDQANADKATVMKFNGAAWVNVGAAGISVGQADYTNIAIDISGTPYVAYQDVANGGKATVMKYNGTAWVTVGTAGFSVGSAALDVSLAIDNSGTPYITYHEGGATNKANVMKFNGTAWVLVGTAGFSVGAAEHTSIAIDAAGIPYVVYKDYDNGAEATVMKFDGAAWVAVGTPGFSAGSVAYTSIAIDANGTPYTVCGDEGYSGKATVMKFNGTAWVTVGGNGFSVAGVDYTDITIDRNGTAYVVYVKEGVWVKRLGTQLCLAATTQPLSATAPFSSSFTSGCNIIAKLTPSGAAPVNGNTTAKVWIESAQPPQYVKRHYEITPATNATTATGRVTLYFTQAEFDEFNAVNSVDLPVNAADAAGIANLRIEKYPGTSSDGSGLPGTYTGTPVTLNPADADIVWNATSNWWEVSFDVTGFSGFFAKTVTGALPVKWIAVNSNLNSSKQAVVEWIVQEVNAKQYEIEKSADNNTYTTVATVNSKGDGENRYVVTETAALNGKGYYRIKQTDKNGKVNYSRIMLLNATDKNYVTIYPNPAVNEFTISTNGLINTKATLYNATGKLMQSFIIKQNNTAVNLSNYAAGVYILKISNGESVKIIKE